MGSSTVTVILFFGMGSPDMARITYFYSYFHFQ